MAKPGWAVPYALLHVITRTLVCLFCNVANSDVRWNSCLLRSAAMLTLSSAVTNYGYTLLERRAAGQPSCLETFLSFIPVCTHVPESPATVYDPLQMARRGDARANLAVARVLPPIIVGIIAYICYDITKQVGSEY